MLINCAYGEGLEPRLVRCTILDVFHHVGKATEGECGRGRGRGRRGGRGEKEEENTECGAIGPKRKYNKNTVISYTHMQCSIYIFSCYPCC